MIRVYPRLIFKSEMGTSESKVNGKPLNIVGKPFRKVDARAKCTGETKFADDIFLPRMLYCKILRSHEPHALIKKIDVARALEVPGVLAIITGKDLPIPYGILPVSQDEHALCIDKVRFIGDPVAAVAAIDEDVAFDAMNRAFMNTATGATFIRRFRWNLGMSKKVSPMRIWFERTLSFTKATRTCP